MIGRTFLSAVAAACLLVSSKASAQDKVDPYEGMLHTSFASVRVNDELFVFGGYLSKTSGPLNILTTNYRLKPENGELRDIEAPFLFGGGDAAAISNGKIYVSGGFGSTYRKYDKRQYSASYTDIFAAYDIAGNSWEELPAMPHKIASHCSFADSENVYVVGGTTESKKGIRKVYGVDNVIHRYSVANRTWSSLETPPNVLAGDAACAALGDEFFIIGGGRAGQPSASVWAWNYKTNTWRALPDLPRPLINAAAAAMGGSIFVHGGYDYSTPRIAYTELLKLSPGAGAWEQVTKSSIGRHGHAMVAIGTGLWLVAGGDDHTLQTPNPYPPHGLWLERVF